MIFNLGICRLDVVVVMEVVILFVIMTANIDVNDVIGVMVMDEESKLILLIKFLLSFMNLFFIIFFCYFYISN